MKKIRLDLDSLKVESFVTSEGSGPNGGTVFGMGDTDCGDTCNGVSPTCNFGGCPSAQCHYTEGLSCTGGEPTFAVGCLETNNCTQEGDTCDSPECPVYTQGAGW